MAREGFKYDNFQAMMTATKQVLPFAVLFYAMNIYFSGGNSAGLIRNIEYTTVFVLGFFVIDFFVARSRQKQASQMAQPQVIVVQQPVYMPPPGYGYGPGGPPQGQPYYPQGQQQYQQPYPPQYQQPQQQPPYQQPYPQQQPQLPAQAPVTAPWPPPQQAPPPAPAGQDDWLPPPQRRKPPPEGTG